MNLTTDQRQVIIGTLLGNGRLESSSDGPYLLMKSRDKLWLSSKAHILSDIEQANWVSRGNYYWRSIADPVFDEFDDLLYDGNNKIVRMEVLDVLQGLGVMVWYSDVGCLVGRNRKNACMRMQAFGKSTEIAVQFFNEVSAPCRINTVRNKPVIVFALEGTIMLMKIIGTLLPENRLHLVPTFLQFAK